MKLFCFIWTTNVVLKWGEQTTLNSDMDGLNNIFFFFQTSPGNMLSKLWTKEVYSKTKVKLQIYLKSISSSKNEVGIGYL